MTANELLDALLLAQDARQRQDDAWDLLDTNGNVAAVLCPRPSLVYVSVALPPGPERPAPIVGRRKVDPYDEVLIARVADEIDPVAKRWRDEPVMTLEAGNEYIRRLAAASALPRAEWIGLAKTLAPTA